MISTNNYICFVIIKTQKPGDCNLGPTTLTWYQGHLGLNLVWRVCEADFFLGHKSDLLVKEC